MLPTLAEAHGPCHGCIKPKRAAAGERVRVKWTAIRVIFNPRPAQVPYGDEKLWKTYHGREASTVVFRSKRPRKSRFRVPQVPPGRYGIAIFDGTEGGAHYTWAYLKVRATAATAAPTHAPNTSPTRSQNDAAGTLWRLALATAAFLLLAAVTAAAITRRSAPRRGHGGASAADSTTAGPRGRPSP